MTGWFVRTKLGRTWKETNVAWVKVSFRNLPGVPEGNHEIPQSGQIFLRLRSEFETPENEDVLPIPQQCSSYVFYQSHTDKDDYWLIAPIE